MAVEKSTGDRCAMRTAALRPGEWRAGWPLLLACVVGMSTPSLAVYSLGQFLGPLEAEFGWSRTQITAGLSVSLILGFLISPVVGRLIDKTNARLLALPGLMFLAVAVAGFSLATGDLALWIALWSVHALAGVLVGPTVWLAVISAAFDRHRSIAMAIALCGTNLSAAFAPSSARLLIDAVGWRAAFQVLGLGWVGLAFLLAAVLFFDRRQRSPHPASRAVHGHTPSQKLRTVFLSQTFIRLALAVFVTTVVSSGYAIHLAPALAEKGLTLVEAATVAGVMGLAAIPGKLATGTLFDRLGIGTSALIIMAVLALSCVLFALPSENLGLAVTACVMLGLATGANIALVTVVTARSFNSSVFGVVYGTIISLTALGAAIGPVVMGAVFDRFGSYSPAFWAGVVAAAIAAILLQKL